MVGKTNKYQNGFSPVETFIFLAVIGILVMAGYSVAHKSGGRLSQLPIPTSQKGPAVTWTQTYEGYKPDGTTPACSTPIVKQFPADINKVTSVIYPGQYWGSIYRPYGGLRFDSSANDEISVKAPFDGTVIDGGAYIADGTENDVQYAFDVMNDCGVMYHIGYLLTLSKPLQEIAKKFPPAEAGNYQTTKIDPALKLKAGSLLASAVGTASGKNVFFDFGIYDWRSPNAISADQVWLSDVHHNNAQAKHSVCWLDMLPKDESTRLRSLPADPVGGKTSDYCH